MSVKYDSSYSATGTDSTDLLYPGGKGVDSTSLSAKDGFPYKATTINDLLGFLQHLIRKGSRGRITTKAQYDAEISGVADNSVSSDYGNGLQAIIDPIDPGVSEYDDTDNYVFGDLVQLYGSQYLCIAANGAATTISNPVADVYAEHWFEIPSEKWLRGKAQVTLPFLVGIKPVFDYNDGSYEMVFPMGIFQKGNQKIEYFMVLHDDSNVISAGNIAFNAMANGTKGATIAALSAGDYTMIDGQDCVVSAMGDNRPASFSRQEDAMQGFQIGYEKSGSTYYASAGTTDATAGATEKLTGGTENQGSEFGLYPKNGGTYGDVRIDFETRSKSLIGGPLAQIVAATTAI